MRPLIVAAFGLLGIVATSVVMWRAGLPANDSLLLAAIAGGAALAIGLVGAAALYLLRGASFGTQATIVVLTAVGAVAAGALAAGNAMFLSGHDLSALSVVVVSAGVVGVLAALTLSGRVGAASRQLADTARQIGDGAVPAHETTPGIREFASLAAELEATGARLEESRRRQRELDAARRELVSWVSHDLRTPLAGIRAVAEALEDAVISDPATVARYHRTLRQEAERLATLVDDLFELSRIHAGALQLKLERVCIGDLVSDALAAADPCARAKGVHVHGHLDGRGVEAELAPDAFGRVLRNLLENAIRETPSDGTVWVDAGKRDGRAYVSVADSCGGIPNDVLSRMFDTGFRGEPARTPSGDARSGLGLAISRGLVEAHHGEIAVRNDGPGCRFTILVPLAG